MICQAVRPEARQVYENLAGWQSGALDARAAASIAI